MHTSLFRSGAASPGPGTTRFDGEELKMYVKKLLAMKLGQEAWTTDKERVQGWVKEIGERVKERMVQIQPSGYKYVVLVQVNENREQGGRTGMTAHWERGDECISEVFYNNTIISTCIALAVRITREGQDR